METLPIHVITMENPVYIYESPDKGKTIFRRKFGETEREKQLSHRRFSWETCEITYVIEWVPERRWTT